MKLTGKPKLKVKIISPTETHYEGSALAISAVNKVGPFDILADHANFFSLLSKGDVVVNTGFENFNSVTLFIGIETAHVSE